MLFFSSICHLDFKKDKNCGRIWEKRKKENDLWKEMGNKCEVQEFPCFLFSLPFITVIILLYPFSNFSFWT